MRRRIPTNSCRYFTLSQLRLFLLSDATHLIHLKALYQKPLVQKSKESNVPFWLALYDDRMCGCSVLAFSASSVLSTNSESGIYLELASVSIDCRSFLSGALTGWFVRLSQFCPAKRQKLAAVSLYSSLL
jgi:hypothetical protein